MIDLRRRSRERIRRRLDAMPDAQVHAVMIEATEGAPLGAKAREQLREGVRLACARFGCLRAALTESRHLFPYTEAAMQRIDSNQARTDPFAMGELPEDVT